MRLAEFMRDNEERILREWDAFAGSLHSAPGSMNANELRDHARGMLRCIAREVEESGDGHAGREQGAAEAHGSHREEWGFTVGDMIAEFRALRRSVIRLWGSAVEHMDAEDLIRFNEAIDRELAESVDSYTKEKEQDARLLEAMLSYTSDHSCIFDLDGNFLYANRALAETYGRRPQEIVGRRIDVLKPAVAGEVHRHLRQVVATNEEHRGELTLTTGKGDVRVIEYLFAPLLDPDGNLEAVAATSRDVTERKQGERTLWKQANHDHLTGVPNRRLFRDRLEQDMRLARRHDETLALLYIDLDKFKDANDHFGHEVGDALLKQAAERIQSCIRETDTLARLGGDEFAVILMGARDADAVEMVAQVILEQLARPFFIRHETVRIAGSIGIALYPGHGETGDELAAHADRAMYSVKSGGGGEYAFFTPERHLQQGPRKHAERHARGRPH